MDHTNLSFCSPSEVSSNRMRTLSIARRVALLSIAGVLSCSRSTTCAQAASCESPVVVDAREGQNFELAPGMRARIASANVTVVFERVTSDSRCPRDVVCIWSGNAAVQLRVETSEGRVWSGSLNTNVEPRLTPLDNYELSVVALSPDPVSSSSIEAERYRLTLRLTQRQP
jgi:hypothetical protein